MSRYVIWKRTPFGGWVTDPERVFRFSWVARLAAAWSGSKDYPCIVRREGASPHPPSYPWVA